jgi:N-acetylneuraminic acid mutarotase
MWEFFEQAGRGTLKIVEPSSSSAPKPQKEEKKASTPTTTGGGIQPPAECSWCKVVVPYEKPVPRRYSTAVLYGGKFYNFGGIAANKSPLNDFYVFDFEQKKWNLVAATGTPPSARYGHSATLHGDGMYVFGGIDSSKNALSDFHVFNFKTNEWSQVKATGSLPGPRYHHSAEIFDNRLVIIGGQTAISSFLNDFIEFSFDSKTWKSVESKEMPSARAGHMTFVHEGSLYLFGGFCGQGGFTYLCDMQRFSSAKGSWEDMDISGVVPKTARPLTCVVDKHGFVYVFGGFDGQHPVRTFHVLIVPELKWKAIRAWMELEDTIAVSSAAVGSVGTEPTPRYGYSITIDKAEGLITVFGGSGSTYFNDIVQFALYDEI